MSNIVNSIKETVTGSGESFPGPSAYKAETQVDRNVGIEADIEGPKPIATKQQGDNGLQEYKAADKLLGKKALVTGGDSGIGRAVAYAYAAEGADVAIMYLPEEEVDAQETRKLIESKGRRALLIPQDQREEEGCKRVIDTVVKEFGGIDCVVLNGGVMYSQPSITDISTEQFKRTMETNVFGTFYLARAAVPHLKSGSSIIITTSQVAYAGPPSLLDYTMTKAAQRGLIYSLNNQLIGRGVRCSGVAPGPVWTPLQPAAMDKSAMDEWHKNPAPIGRIGQPSELAGAYVLLASADGSFMSGSVLQVNGGSVLNC